MATDALEVLETARKLIEQGWARGTYETDDGRFCMIGALRKAAWGSSRSPLVCNVRPGDAEFEAYRGARSRLQMVVGQPVGTWNDLYSRKKSEVLQAFSEAIGNG